MEKQKSFHGIVIMVNLNGIKRLFGQIYIKYPLVWVAILMSNS